MPSVVEVHPSATMVLRGGPVKHVLAFAADQNARRPLLNWLEGQRLDGIITSKMPSAHYVAACACARGVEMGSWPANLGSESLTAYPSF